MFGKTITENAIIVSIGGGTTGDTAAHSQNVAFNVSGASQGAASSKYYMTCEREDGTQFDLRISFSETWTYKVGMRGEFTHSGEHLKKFKPL